jgi:hypothetical protein
MKIETNSPRPNLDLILSTIPLAIRALDREATASVIAMAAAMAVHDAAVATFGSARCLTATSRDKDASVEERNAYIILKDAAVVEAWGKVFTDKVNNGKGAKDMIGAPKKGMASNTRLYWQMQKGKVFGRITDRIAKAIAQTKADNAAPIAADGTKAPNRKAPIDQRAIDAMGAPMKAMATALAATNGKGEQIPPHVDAPAYLRLCELALLALSPVKEKQNLARLCLAAYDAVLAADKASAKIDRKPKPLATKVKASKSPAPVKGQTAKQNPADIK